MKTSSKTGAVAPGDKEKKASRFGPLLFLLPFGALLLWVGYTIGYADGDQDCYENTQDQRQGYIKKIAEIERNKAIREASHREREEVSLLPSPYTLPPVHVQEILVASSVVSDLANLQPEIFKPDRKIVGIATTAGVQGIHDFFEIAGYGEKYTKAQASTLSVKIIGFASDDLYFWLQPDNGFSQIKIGKFTRLGVEIAWPLPGLNTFQVPAEILKGNWVTFRDPFHVR